MKNYYSFLNENKSLISLDIEDVRKLIKEKCEGFTYEKAIFYRRQHQDGIFLLSKPSLRTRYSNYGVHYTISLIDGWKQYGYPERSHSISFSNDIEEINQFGDTTYYIIPLNGVNIGLSKLSDFNYNSCFDTTEINKQLKMIFEIIAPNKYNAPDHIIPGNIIWKPLVGGYEELKDVLNKVQISDIEDSDTIYKDIFMEAIKEYGSLLKYFENLTKPTDKCFIRFIMDWNNVPEIDEGSELWTDGDCILIEYNTFNRIFKL